MFDPAFLEKNLKQQKVYSYSLITLYLIAFSCFLNLAGVYDYLFLKNPFCLEQVLPLYMPYSLETLPIDFSCDNVYTGRGFSYGKVTHVDSPIYKDTLGLPINDNCLVSCKNSSVETLCYQKNIRPVCLFMSHFLH